jgi:hypothetical protein
MNEPARLDFLKRGIALDEERERAKHGIARDCSIDRRRH